MTTRRFLLALVLLAVVGGALAASAAASVRPLRESAPLRCRVARLASAIGLPAETTAGTNTKVEGREKER